MDANQTRKALLFEALSKRSFDLKTLAQMPEYILKKVHYSWLVLKIEKLPKAVRQLYLSALSERQAIGICKLLNEEPKKKPLTPLARAFFITNFYKRLETSEIIPIPLIPKSDFLEMAQWGKKDLLELIDLLGLHDLSTELRKIVDNRIIKEIYNVLSSRKQNFLKKCLMQKEKLSVSKLNIAQYRGDPKKLLMVLHRRGLIRLGKAMSKESPYLLWYVSHTLDTGRGAFFLKCTISNKTPTEAIHYLQRQVKEGMEFLKKESE